MRIRNFKRFTNIDIELGKAVVLIGPNNSGKTTALQALTLWDIGIRQWLAARGGKASPETRPGVTINRRDLVSIPVPATNLLWRNMHVRESDKDGAGKAKTKNVRVDIILDGITDGKPWSCGFEFDYSNDESFVCRPVRLEGFDDVAVKSAKFSSIPDGWKGLKLAMLPPMSGLAAVEPKWEPGRINVLLGEGQTAQVLRNLCYQIYQQKSENENWSELVKHIKSLFGVALQPPDHIVERGEITMEYEDQHGIELDLSSAGRGLQQTVLLLAHLYANPNTVLLLDEPDAHLEILRQRQIYQLITDLADRQGSQIIAASHSEVVLNEAADRHIVVAFVGQPHRIDDRGKEAVKSLKEIGFDQYYSAEQRGWVLYLEGSTDLSMLKAFAKTLGHAAYEILSQSPFVHYVMNQPERVKSHFHGLREAKPDLQGVAIFDSYGKIPPDDPFVRMLQWRKRELENYLVSENVLMAYATQAEETGDLFGQAEADRRRRAMRDAITEITGALRILGKEPYGATIKATDEFLDPLFKSYFDKLQIPNLMRKSDYDLLAGLVPANQIESEVGEKLDVIVEVAGKARPLEPL
ncbi:MAG: ATP-binding protein [Planctomycetota bacterium]|nr:ATP-binding protein [Planctomycetota bacterium]